MKKKTWFIGLILLILIGGAGFMWFKQNEAERKEQDMVRMETVTAKQIKNTFADVTKIKFSENYGENKLTGYTEVMVTVSTRYGVNSEIGVSMSPKDKVDESYLGSGELPVLKKGITETEAIVVFSNKEERSF
ncbi:hypothetical protein ACFFIF_09000 [Vagococcus entomophilus]|uniref:DUF1433 domain-containing protein n=1 Tax=Vagococcus entomophilus TaxID=1160095 RepID=A0A430AH54_9ENTE|nr:hypothetical protein [Vagococcus entomophilus]RSU07107.1 hypothetical protein CBF30_07575 [Vagococcus entomophilus]